MTTISIEYDDSGVDFRRYLVHTFQKEWVAPPAGWFTNDTGDQALFANQAFKKKPGYYANSNQPKTNFWDRLWGDEDLSGKKDHLGFVVESSGHGLGTTYTDGKRSFVGPIEKITLGRRVESIEGGKKFVVHEPMLTFTFFSLKAEGEGSVGDDVIDAFNEGDASRLFVASRFDQHRNDTIQVGGEGNDVMYGYAGHDIFEFRSRNIGKDEIRNFDAMDASPSHDKLRISTEIFKDWDEMKSKMESTVLGTVITIDEENSILIKHANTTLIGPHDIEFLTADNRIVPATTDPNPDVETSAISGTSCPPTQTSQTVQIALPLQESDVHNASRYEHVNDINGPLTLGTQPEIPL